MPPEGHTFTNLLPQPNSGFGARAVMNLSSRLLTSLLPPGRSFVRLAVTPEALLEAGEDSVPAQYDLMLARMEKLIQAKVERLNWRAATNVTLQQLIVSGNALEQMLPDGSLRTFRLDQYVVVRDPAGRVIEIVIEERLFPESLTGKLKAMFEARDARAKHRDQSAPQTVSLYTWVKREGDQWTVHQELEEDEVPGSRGRYAADALPFYALRWSNVAGEDYGRGKGEEHLPDLILIDGLSKAMSDGAAMASRNITCIRPGAQGGVNLMRRLAKANNGEYVVADPDDVQMLQFTNTSGLQVTQAELQLLRQEVGSAFLLGASNVRDAERVTATEVRMMAQELEGVLGGVYTLLSRDMLMARTTRLVLVMQDGGALPEWPDDVVEPTILTGLEALGREQAVQAVMGALGMLNGLPPEIVGDYVDWPELLAQGFMGLGLPAAVRSEEEAEQRRQQRAQQQMMADMAGRAAGPMAAAAAQQMTEQA